MHLKKNIISTIILFCPLFILINVSSSKCSKKEYLEEKPPGTKILINSFFLVATP